MRPDTADRVILRAAERLGITEANAQTIFHRLLVDLGGWAQHARWLLWEAELAGETDATIAELLAIRLIWEEALLAQYPQLASAWEETRAAHEQPVAPTRDQVIDAILQEAAERARQRRIEAMLPGAQPREGRPAIQAAFCIDVRSEVFRRALESLDTDIATIGFAGFFGLPVSHCGHGTDRREAHLPVLLTPALEACSHSDAHTEQDVRIRARGAARLGTLPAGGGVFLRLHRGRRTDLWLEARQGYPGARSRRQSWYHGGIRGLDQSAAALRGAADGRGQGRHRRSSSPGDEHDRRPCPPRPAHRPWRACHQQPA